MRLATIDVGTNTAQLLVADRDDPELRRIHGAERFVRLGEGVDAQGRISTAARDRLLDALHPAAMEGRADVFPIGVMLLDRIMDRYDRDTCRVSPYELRYGPALRTLASAEADDPGANVE